ncbi:DedA family protein/thiosulfate sulfurtransferase GlpE [Herbaspirillum sp. AP02]|uniref:DedA family protein/thiosulfate sulfurtransferase GlpE n=1 Tax=unclassified Herbaspirillum TaxID=2624150 RepID=UPI0015DAFA5F|nr:MULTISPECIES: DedA family protein/thiosulfate sulfurtransferase GlpE [unclassified Herbaspirillum]MBG7622071.1 DedA family protein/thiosulfate sulfurtransferase GlpE [Herbaspirillum sp. AP02]NZD70014.1 VTT domain-containing protein [Herbaspirillum sp. AP21]
METLYHLIEQYGLILVFVNVLVEQLGAPVPAYPTLIITGALSATGRYSPLLLLALAVCAALMADYVWYLAGRRYGRQIMSRLCRISLSPDSCVRQTESIYLRWGVRSLLLAKFIPGFASIASALSGTMGTRRISFLLWDAAGSALWAGLGIFLGSLFSSAVDDLLNVLAQLGHYGMLMITVALAAFVANKWWQRRRFRKSLEMARITVDELNTMLEQGNAPTIIDVRSPLLQQDGRIPGAVTISNQEIQTFVFDGPVEGEVVVYCACPNEASAAVVARQLMRRGYTRVRPLTGGIDAWRAAGYAIDV